MIRYLSIILFFISFVFTAHSKVNLLYLKATSSQELELLFDVPVDISRAVFEILYIDNGGKPISKVLSADKKQLTLKFSPFFIPDYVYVLGYYGVSSATNPSDLITASTRSFAYTDLQFGDIVITEIMANPPEEGALPCVEYIELYNRRERSIPLKNFEFVYNGKGYPLPAYTLQGGAYAILCKAGQESLFPPSCHPVGVTSFPVLANTGKLIWLENPTKILLSFVHYSDAWYSSSQDKGGGVSLECIDVSNFSGSSSNWSSSLAWEGGTPGKENSIKGSHPDQIHPKVLSIALPSADSCMVYFSKPMDIGLLSDPKNYSLSSGQRVIQRVVCGYPMADFVTLCFNKPLEQGVIYPLSVSPNLKDVSALALDGRVDFELSLPQTPQWGDLSFNEILFNPYPLGVDYIELYNASDKYVDISRLYMASLSPQGRRSTLYPLSTKAIIWPPFSYLLATTDQSKVSPFYTIGEGIVSTMGKFPSLPNDQGGLVLLSDERSELLDSLLYFEKMHSPWIKNYKGVSLEKIHPSFPSFVSSSWLSASMDAGLGTPLAPNSQYKEIGENVGEDVFQLESLSFSPNGDGVDDVLIISYQMEEEGWVGHVSVFDISGREVARIVDKGLMGRQGRWTWNGSSWQGNPVGPGLYLIKIEALSDRGGRILEKKAVGVGL